jgi:hypothetical protein
MRLKKKLYFIGIQLFLTVSFAQTTQTVENVIKKAAEKFKTEKYFTYNIKYNIYNDQNSNVVNYTYSGFLLKKNDIMYYKIKNTEFVQFKDYSVKVSKDEKAIQVSKDENAQMPMDLSQFLKGFNYKFIGNDKTNWICELVPAKVSQIMFSKIVIYINKQNYSVSKQVLYFLNPIEENKKKAKPKTEIIFSTRNKNQASDNFLIDEKNYFIRSNKDIKVASRFKEYELYKV